MTDVVKHYKYITLAHGYKKYISPLFVVGNLIAAGVDPTSSHTLAETILEAIPEDGISESEFFEKILEFLPEDQKYRFVQLDLMKKFFVSSKSNGPLYLFLGGFSGKTFLSTHIQQHLGINRVFSLDDEKYIVKMRNPDHAHLSKATYEDTDVYEKTLESFYPRMKERMDENIHDYTYHKKWVYFWEGIYLSPHILKKLVNHYPQVEHLTIMLIPEFEEIKRRYVIRWMSELGEDYISQNKDTIEFYINNIERIKEVMLQGAKEMDAVIISPHMFEETLKVFYDALHKKLGEVAEKNGITPWIEKVSKTPSALAEYISFLQT